MTINQVEAHLTNKLWDDVLDDDDLLLLLHEENDTPVHQKYECFAIDNFAREEFRKFF